MLETAPHEIENASSSSRWMLAGAVLVTVSRLTLVQEGLETDADESVQYLAYQVTASIYDVYFGPLARFPGPKSWAFSMMPWMHMVWSGGEVAVKHELHEKYGSVVRIAPRALSFSSAQAWKDIHGHVSTTKKVRLLGRPFLL